MKVKLIVNLLVLKKGRNKLVKDFIEEEPEIFKPMFKYENNKSQMALSKEKYFLTWMNLHWRILNNIITEEVSNLDLAKSIKDSFFKEYIKLLKSWGNNVKNKENSHLMTYLINKKINFLNEALDIGDRSDKLFNKLEYEYERDKKLFEREINRLENGG